MSTEGYPRTVTLKDGRAVVLRQAVREDAESLLAFFRTLPEEDRLFLREDVTKQAWADRFAKREDADLALSLVAEHQGQIVAHAHLDRPEHGWSAHVAGMRVVVARPFQRAGLATRLVRSLLEIGVNRGVEKVVLHLVENQVGPLRAFERLGFRREAVLRGHVKDLHGQRRDLVVLSNDVAHLWESMEALVSDYSPQVGD